jgi:hypothetical protein
MPWLLNLLNTQSLSGVDIPPIIQGIIYINDSPKTLQQGAWEISSSSIHLARTSVSRVDGLIKIAILTSIANLTNTISESAIINAITKATIHSMQESLSNIYSGVIKSANILSKLAIDPITCRTAIQQGTDWFLPGGSLIEVTDSWIIMDL